LKVIVRAASSTTMLRERSQRLTVQAVVPAMLV
jgi:hypothetical protein